MLHLRIVAPPALTADVLDALRAERGACNVAVFPGAALHPAGDWISVDIAREAADGLLARLRAIGLLDEGSISIDTVETALGDAAERARTDAPGEGSDALVWEQLHAATGDDSTLSVSFLLFLVIATLIAAVGLLTDSQVLIVGAMVLGPEFGPLAGMAVGAVQRRRSAVWRSGRALLVGFPAAIAVTAAGVALLDAAGRVPVGYVQGQRPLTSFVAHPDVFSVIVALLAGVAGTLSLTAAKAGPLVGVFISVTTVPAAAEIAASVVTGQRNATWGACEQLGVNLVCIVVAAIVTLMVQHWLWRRVTRGVDVGVRV